MTATNLTTSNPTTSNPTTSDKDNAMTDKNTRFLLSSSPENLRAALDQVQAKGGTTATVEAEYGDVVVTGSVATLAHHGPRKNNPCPCVDPTILDEAPDAVGLSHVDLDALGGWLGLLGRRPDAPAFWQAASFVDTNGPHRLHESGADATVTDALNAYWAWSEKHRCFAPRDGSVLDVTGWAAEAEAALRAILLEPQSDMGRALLETGRDNVAKFEALDKDSFEGVFTNVLAPSGQAQVILRLSQQFVSSLYRHEEITADAVVAYNDANHSVTISLYKPLDGVSCRDIVQGLWGKEAGGHDGIAGSPRNVEMTLEDAHIAVGATIAAISRAAWAKK